MKKILEKKKMGELTHLDSEGRARMVDVGDKAATRRVAVAGGWIAMSAEALSLLKRGEVAKGDALAVARVAAIAAAKKTADWIPLCHSLPLESVQVDFFVDDELPGVRCEARAATTAKTGVEMEALTAVQAGLLTLYDMLKAADKTMLIGGVCLLKKQGGKSGDFVRPANAKKD